MQKSGPERSLSDRAGFLIAANIIKFSIGVLMPITLARFLSKTDYGTYQQLVLVGTVAAGILTLGLPTSVFYFYRHVKPERVPALIVQTSGLLLIGGALASAIVYFGANAIADSLNNPGISEMLALSAGAVGLGIAGEQSISFLIAQNRYGMAVIFEVGEAAVRVAMLLLPLWLGWGLRGLVIFLVVFAALRLVVRTYALFTTSGVSFQHWRQELFIGEQLHYSIPIALVALVSLVGSTVNKGILSASFGPANYAIFAVGSLVFPLAQVFQAAVANVLRAELPSLARQGLYTELARVVRESVRRLSIIVLPSFVFLFVHADQFVTTLFSNAYVESIPVFRICVWELPLDMFVLSAIPQVFGKTRANLYINIAANVVMLCTSYTLIRNFGLYGAAFASVGVQYFAVILFFVVALRLTHVSLSQLIPFPGISRVVAAAIAAVIASRLTGDVTAYNLLNLLIDAAVFTVAFFIVAGLIGTFTLDDRRLARRWIAKVVPISPG